MELHQLISIDAKRKTDAERFEKLDQDECQLCYARGADKRSLIIHCLYDIQEVVPEAIDLSGVKDGIKEKMLVKCGYYLRICKACRGRLLAKLEEWRKECIAQILIPKNHDGEPTNEITPPDAYIPYRVYGRTRMVTKEEYPRLASKKTV